jgi:hypothetical protein
MNELSVANLFLFQQLLGDTDLANACGRRFYADFAPQPTTPDQVIYPCVLWHEQAAKDCHAMGQRRFLSEPLFLVKAVGRGGYNGIVALADRIDAVLHNDESPVVVTLEVGGQNWNVISFRERGMQMSEYVEGVRFSHIGGLYRLQIQRAAP